ncbi:hypothetical protein ACQCT6_12135 [Cytobacillus gottheilii]|uniref:hypothetical protein n=1 Tax=Cytobacillus gottheilii TaxID=859144 RepID=UPI003CF6E389
MMSSHIKEEFSYLSEAILSILLVGTIAIFCSKTFESITGPIFFGLMAGLSLIIFCWEGKRNKWGLLLAGLIFNSFVWSIYFILS